MKIIMAVLDGGSHPKYNKMRDIWKGLIKALTFAYASIDIVFLRASPSITETTYDPVTNTLWTPGEESVMPGILEKTHEAIKYFTSIPMKKLKVREWPLQLKTKTKSNNIVCDSKMTSLPDGEGASHSSENTKNFDYFVRTNLSSLFDFKVMVNWLQENPLDYGGKLENAFDEWEFASGAGIYLSWKGCQVFLDHYKEMAVEHDLLDDVAIGKVMQRYIPMTYVPRITFSYSEDPEILDLLTNDYKDIFHYRCHSDDQHLKTVEYMKQIYVKIYRR